MRSFYDDKMIANEVSSPWPKMIQVTIRCEEKSEKGQAEMMSFGEPITPVGAWDMTAR